MKVLITGGAGYVGTELVYQLAENKAIDELVIYDNLSRENYNLFIGVKKFKGVNIRFVNGDLLDSRRLRKELQNIDIVYHLAAKVTTPFADQNSHLFEQVNHWGTAELVYAVEESNVSKLIYLSSASVYGSSSEKVTIDTPLNPRTFYGISKMRGEKHIRRLSDKMPVYIIRCGNAYGYSKSMRFDAVINKFMFEANFKGRVTIHGDGKQYRAFVHINRLAKCLSKIVGEEVEPSTYNLVENNFSVMDIVENLKDIYPELEMIFVNQHLKLREIMVEPDQRLNKIMDEQFSSLNEELQEFKAQFTF